MSNLPANYEQVQENYNNPKNRFLWCTCHANEVDDSWGFGFSYGCGVIAFGILMLIPTVADIVMICDGHYKCEEVPTREIRKKCLETPGLFYFFLSLRMLANILSLVGTGFTAAASKETRYRQSVIGYYCLAIAFILNSIFLVYTLIRIPALATFINFKYISFGLGDFIMLIFAWLAFCLMVRTAARRQQMAAQASPY